MAYFCYRTGLTHGVNGKKYFLILIYLKATKKRSDGTYLNWKERKTDSAPRPSKANDRTIFLLIFFKILFPRSHAKFWPHSASKYVPFTLLVCVRPYVTKWEDEAL